MLVVPVVRLSSPSSRVPVTYAVHGHHEHGQHARRTSPRPAWRPAAGSGRPGGPGRSAACPAGASPAIASPAVRATAIGRNSGSTIASAASGNRVPSVITADRNAGPVPGPRPEVGDGQQDRDQGRQRVDQQDRHPRTPAQQQLAQLDGDHGRDHRSEPGRLASSTTSSSVAPLLRQRRDRDAGRHQPRVQRRRVAVPHQQPVAVVLLDATVQQAARRVRLREW